jgi:hypothetical protein
MDFEILQTEKFMYAKFSELQKMQEKIQSEKSLKYLVRLLGSHFLFETE